MDQMTKEVKLVKINVITIQFTTVAKPSIRKPYRGSLQIVIKAT